MRPNLKGVVLAVPYWELAIAVDHVGFCMDCYTAEYIVCKTSCI